MKNTKRSAFTIVELVIVIAVIAILSAVLIPTFGSIIKDANVAADKATANMLTTELHTYLKGEVIDSEEELMDVLSDEKSGIGKKLVPKSAQYGYHYWFNMVTQTIFCATSKDVADMTVDAQNGSVIDGPALMNEIVAQNNETANISFRDIYGKRIFFVDHNTTLGNIVDKLDSLERGSDYSLIIKALLAFENTEDVLGAKLLETLQNTIIISNAGSFYFEGATDANVAFVSGVKGSVSKHFVSDENGNVTEKDASEKDASTGEPINKLPSVKGDVVLPDDMDYVGDNSLNFTGDANIVVDENKVENVFCEDATNATINDKYTIEGDKLMDGETEVTTLVSLEGRFPHLSFGINQQGDNTNKTYEWNNGNLYLSYYTFIKNAGKYNIVLTGNEGKNATDTMGYVNWTCTGDVSVGSVTENGTTTYNVLTVTGDGHVKGTVTLINGTKGEVEFDVFVSTPQNTTVDIGDYGSFSIPYTGNQGQSIIWDYNGADGEDSKTIVLGEIVYNQDFAKTTPVFDVTYNTNVFTYDPTNGKLTLNKDKNGNITLDKDEDGKTINDYTITFSVDGVISSVIKVTVNDYTNARLVSDFHYNSDANYLYHIGNGEFTLGDILKLKGSDLPYDSNVVILAKAAGGTAFLPVAALENWTVEFDGDFDSEDWASAKINFSAGQSGQPIQIKITPKDASYGSAATITFDFVYKNATNVSTVADLVTYAATNDVVIMEDLTITDNNTKIVVGEGKTLYGNGFIIDASNYVPSYPAIEICKECRKLSSKCTNFLHGLSKATIYRTDLELITVNGGNINNVYLEGPVYSDAQFDSDYHFTYQSGLSLKHGVYDGYGANKYYVSGIKLVGNSTMTNSYASGFRQPVQVSGASGTTATIDNTTLYGGNLANISVVSGNVKLKNVTTVQDVDNSSVSKIGAGVLVEGYDAVASNVIIEGNLYQYNWFCQDYSSKLPTVSVHGTSLPLSTLSYLAFEDAIIDKMGEITHTAGTKKYINTGIIYLVLDQSNAVSSEIFTGEISGATGLATREASIDEIYAMSDIFQAVKLIIGDMKAAFSVNTYSNTKTPVVAPGASFSNSGNHYINYGK